LAPPAAARATAHRCSPARSIWPKHNRIVDPSGRKRDFPDAERLVKRLVAQELTLSFVPDAEQRLWRTVMRRTYQVTRNRVQLQNRLDLGQLDQQMADLLTVHHDGVQRLAEAPGLGVDSAQQIIAEVGATAATGKAANWLFFLPGGAYTAWGAWPPEHSRLQATRISTLSSDPLVTHGAPG
jgi:transposase